MNKKYIFLTSSISNIGGAQLYIRNKMQYLKKKGWEVDIISAGDDNVPIIELKDYKKRCYEILYKYFLYKKVDRCGVVEKLSKMVFKHEREIVIESNSVSIATWGEELSKRIKARHIVYLIDENVTVSNRYIWNYLKYKNDRKELASIYPITFKRQTISEVLIPTKLVAQASKIVEADVDSPFIGIINKNKYNYVIGFFSRLLKPFVIPAFKDIKEYIESYKEKVFLLLIIGDDNVPQTAQVRELFKFQKNVNLVITGRLYPVPIRLLELCDAFVGSAGCANVCYRSGVPTISYDAKDHKPIGVMGYTTEEGVYRKNNEDIPLFKELLDDILMNKKYPRTHSHYSTEDPDYNTHLDFVENSSNLNDYYSMDDMNPDSTIERLMMFILYVGGYNALAKCVSKYKRYRRIMRHII